MAAENDLLSKLEEMMNSKLSSFEQRITTSQQQVTQTEVSRLQADIGTAREFTFRKKGNECQSRVNTQIMDKLREADVCLQGALETGSSDKVVAARHKVTEGMNILSHRQKLIKLADSSDNGWRVVQEYESHPLAEDSDDEKKIYRAQMSANRKVQQEKKARSKRFVPYTPYRGNVSATSTAQSNQPAEKPASRRRPGLCFRCGRPGHWRQDCKAVVPEVGALGREQQISSILLSSVEHVSHIDNEEPMSPVGKLKNSLSHWKQAGANDYLMEVVSQGYKLPFREIPEKAVLNNNKSALDNPGFVLDEIESLKKKGCVSEVKYVPHVVNPLTVAYGKTGKPRMVLDCRHINPDLFKYKCCFEDQSIAKEMFGTGDYMFAFDIRGAYHHVMIFPDHRTYLGFSWSSGDEVRYFVFNVLPFGISTAGFIFTKLMRVLVKKWRAEGHRIVVFLDDGLGGASDYGSALHASVFIHADLQKFGFLIAENKCCWIPCQILNWLGYTWNTADGMLSVSEERVHRLMLLITDLLEKIGNGNLIFPVRKIARLMGQLISMQTAVGKMVRLRTRSLYNCVVSRAGWNAPVMVSSQALGEIEFWRENIRSLNKADLSANVSKLESANKEQTIVFCDASGAGFGGFIEGLRLNQAVDHEVQGSCVDSSKFGDLPGKMADFLVLAKSDSTNVKYLGYYKKWEQFISGKGESALPASPIHVALYLTELMDKRTSNSIVQSTAYSIKWAHSLRNLPDPTNNSFVKNLLEASKRVLSKPVCKKEPISTDVLIELCNKYEGSTNVLIIRDLCMILIAFAGFLRFDELVHLHCNDVMFFHEYLSLHIRQSKTDQYRKGDEVVISRGTTKACPYSMLRRYLEVTKLNTQENVFLFRPCYRSKYTCGLIHKNKALSYTRSRETVVSRLREVVGDLNIGLHSLRAGGASKAANAGVNDRCWKRHGRWKGENSKDGYVAESLERRLSVSRSLEL